MFNRDLRGSDTWCGLHNVVVFVMAGVMLMTAEASAGAVSNSFVIVEGEGVRVGDDGRIGFSAGPERTVTATARSGWRVNGRDSVSFKTSPGVFMTLEMTCATGEGSETVDCEEDEDSEDECEWEEYYETTHVEGTRCAVKVTVDPERQAVMYALPAKGTNVSVSADYEVVAKAKHETYRRWRCVKHQNCDKTHDPEKEFVESFDVEPDTFAWTATGTNGTVRSSAWSGFLSKGLDQAVAFELKASKSGCGDPGCRCEASEKAYVDVYELSIDRPDEYLGLDMTDAMKEEYVTREATATIDPAPASATYSWKGCGRCVFMGDTDKSKVTYGGCDKTGGSDSYLAEELTVAATAKNATGQEASATCTTNFTVVAVNVSVGGAGEDGEEDSAKEVYYCKDNDDGSLKDFAKENLVPVRITCQPEDLPGIVELAPDSKYAQLFERGKSGSVTLAQTSYPCSEIGKEDFVLHGHSLPDGWWDKAVSFFTTDSLTVTHADSGAVDKGAFKVVPPPPLQVTVNFSSPSGKWPYDPVWDNPAYSNTVDGSLAEWCAGHPGEAKVAYMLSRDAAEIEGKLYKDCGKLSSDVEIDMLNDMLPLKGVHISKWSLPKDLDMGTYYAKVMAVEGETGEERSAESNTGELVREDYYQSDASPVMFYTKDLEVTLKEQRTDAGVRYWSVWAITIGGAAYAATFAEAVAAYLGVAAGAANIINDGVNFVGGAAIGYAIAGYSDITEVPQWLRYGVGLYDKKWTAWRMKWNETTRQYEEAKKGYYDKWEYDESGNVKRVLQMTQMGRFEMGFERYMKSVETEDAGTQLGILNEGFYSLEWESHSLAELFLKPTNMHGYDLHKEWAWGNKPYGLAKPIIKKDSTVTK